MDKCGSDAGVDAAGEPQNHLFGTDGLADIFDRLIDKRAHSPVALASADFMAVVGDDLFTLN